MADESIPATPGIIAPSPTGTDAEDGHNYFAPMTRSAAKRMVSSTGSIKQNGSADSDREARGRSRTPDPIRRRATGIPAATTPTKTSSSEKTISPSTVQKSEPIVPPGLSNGFLSPASAARSAQYYWREISRSPSPLGLIPIHKSWRSLIHKHEVPRKALHISIGFVTLYLYCRGWQAVQIYPGLLVAAVFIGSVDFVRHNSESFNRLYVRVLGAFMRETEVKDKYNGVIFYLVGAWFALRVYPNDIAVLSILLLSWCDTAASTFGRIYGRYTPRVRKGKSLAGTAAAALVGLLAALLFYGYFVPRFGSFDDSFQFKGTLTLPFKFGVNPAGIETSVFLTSWVALGVLGVASGLIASFSEAVDIFGIDDNLTIPVISGALLWGFLKLLE